MTKSCRKLMKDLAGSVQDASVLMREMKNPTQEELRDLELFFKIVAEGVREIRKNELYRSKLG